MKRLFYQFRRVKSPPRTSALAGCGVCQGGPDVLVDAEEIRRIVFGFDRREPQKIGTKSSIDDLLRFGIESPQQMGARGKRLESLLGVPSPIAMAKRFRGV